MLPLSKECQRKETSGVVLVERRDWVGIVSDPVLCVIERGQAGRTLSFERKLLIRHRSNPAVDERSQGERLLKGHLMAASLRCA